MTFLSCQWLVDEPRAVPRPSELAATAQPIGNSPGPSKNHGPLASANQHLTGGDLGRRGPRQAPGSPQSCDASLPVAAARPPAALLLLHPARIAASLQQPPAGAQLYYRDRQNSQWAHRKSGRFPSHGRRQPARTPASCKRQQSQQSRTNSGEFSQFRAEIQRWEVKQRRWLHTNSPVESRERWQRVRCLFCQPVRTREGDDDIKWSHVNREALSLLYNLVYFVVKPDEKIEKLTRKPNAEESLTSIYCHVGSLKE